MTDGFPKNRPSEENDLASLGVRADQTMNTAQISTCIDSTSLTGATASTKTRRITKFGHATRFLPLPQKTEGSLENCTDENRLLAHGHALNVRSPLNVLVSQQIFPFPMVQVQGKTYFELCLLGKGATAQVYKVVDERGIIYALKKVNMKSSVSDDLRLLADMTKEIEVFGKCQNFPFVVQLIAEEYSENLAIHYFLMEHGELDASKLIEENRIEIAHWIQVSIYG